MPGTTRKLCLLNSLRLIACGGHDSSVTAPPDAAGGMVVTLSLVTCGGHDSSVTAPPDAAGGKVVTLSLVTCGEHDSSVTTPPDAAGGMVVTLSLVTCGGHDSSVTAPSYGGYVYTHYSHAYDSELNNCLAYHRQASTCVG